jgi:hypothetical protein
MGLTYSYLLFFVIEPLLMLYDPSIAQKYASLVTSVVVSTLS